MICNWKAFREYLHQLFDCGAAPEKEGMLSRRHTASGAALGVEPGSHAPHPHRVGGGAGEGWSVSTGLNVLPRAPETPVLGPFPH